MTAATGVPVHSLYTPRQRTWTLATVSLSTMLYALAVTLVNVALPQLQGALSATPDEISWIVTLNVVATAVCTPLTGWMVSRWGQRRVSIWALVGFAFASLMCATVTSLAELIAWRIVQGFAGAPLVPLGNAILVNVFPPQERARALGVFGVAVVIGPAVAPAVGGYLSEEYGWRSVFLLLLPLCTAALVATLFNIRDMGRQAFARLDWTGFLALSVAISCLQLLMDQGEKYDWFESFGIQLLAAGMVLAFWVFIVHIFTTDEPFISPRIFLDRNFSIGLILVFVYGMLNFTPTVLFPPMLQNLKGWPDGLIGWMLAMRGAGMVMGFLIASRMGRFDPRVGLTLGLGAIAYSGWEMIHYDLNVTVFDIAWTGIIQGIGCGLMWVPLSVVTFASLPEALVPQASSIFHLLRNFGTSIFISVAVATLLRTSKVNYAEIGESITPFREALQFGVVTGNWSTENTAGLLALSGELARQAQMIGYTNAYLLYLVVCLAVMPTLLFVRIKR